MKRAEGRTFSPETGHRRSADGRILCPPRAAAGQLSPMRTPYTFPLRSAPGPRKEDRGILSCHRRGGRGEEESREQDILTPFPRKTIRDSPEKVTGQMPVPVLQFSLSHSCRVPGARRGPIACAPCPQLRSPLRNLTRNSLCSTAFPLIVCLLIRCSPPAGRCLPPPLPWFFPCPAPGDFCLTRVFVPDFHVLHPVHPGAGSGEQPAASWASFFCPSSPVRRLSGPGRPLGTRRRPHEKPAPVLFRRCFFHCNSRIPGV